jgi:hypothetical protein
MILLSGVHLPHATSDGYDLPAKLVVDYGYATDQLDFALTVDGFPSQKFVVTVDRDEILRSPNVYAFAGCFTDKKSLYFEYQSDSPTWKHYSWQVKGSKH